MTDPITPPPELVEQWREKWNAGLGPFAVYIATCAAKWGADQELEACCEWTQCYAECGDSLRKARRPKPPSLKEQALHSLVGLEHGVIPSPSDYDTIRRALEALPE